MPDTKFSLIDIGYEKDGIVAFGRLVIGESGKLEFEGNAEESAKVFFDTYLKGLCEEHIELIIDKRNHPLFYWKENAKENI